jgi:hypothetical protein
MHDSELNEGPITSTYNPHPRSRDAADRPALKNHADQQILNGAREAIRSSHALLGAGERCPKCKGEAHSEVEVIGGRRIMCPACDGSGVVRVPVAEVIPKSCG